MNKILVAFSALRAGLLVFAGTASASSFTINYAGTVLNATDHVTGDVPDAVGKSISGQVTFGGNSSTTPGTDITQYDNVTWSFQVGSDPASTGSATFGHVALANPGAPSNQATAMFIAGGPFGGFDVDLTLIWQPTTQLVSLATFPTDEIAAAAYFAAALSGDGHVGQHGPVKYHFNITSFTAGPDVAATPLPAAVWLFLSALGGLGWFARRQHALQAASAAA